MRYDLVIFDLDGTLLDTLDDLADAANHILTEAGLPVRTRPEIRRFIGNGAANMIRLAAPDGTPQSRLDALLARFKAHYAAHVNERTLPFPGIPELLRALQTAGVHTAVNSNKPDGPAKALCEAHFGSLIGFCAGEKPDTPRKPAPDGALRIMRELGVPAGRTLYVGDGDTDLMTAGSAGIDGAWVSWGYRDREDLGETDVPLSFDSPAELQAFLLA